MGKMFGYRPNIASRRPGSLCDLVGSVGILSLGDVNMPRGNSLQAPSARIYSSTPFSDQSYGVSTILNFPLSSSRRAGPSGT